MTFTPFTRKCPLVDQNPNYVHLYSGQGQLKNESITSSLVTGFTLGFTDLLPSPSFILKCCAWKTNPSKHSWNALLTECKIPVSLINIKNISSTLNQQEFSRQIWQKHAWILTIRWTCGCNDLDLWPQIYTLFILEPKKVSGSTKIANRFNCSHSSELQDSFNIILLMSTQCWGFGAQAPGWTKLPKGEKTSFLKYSQFGERLPGGVGRRHMVLKCLGVVRQRSAEVVRGEDPLEVWDDGWL